MEFVREAQWEKEILEHRSHWIVALDGVITIPAPPGVQEQFIIVALVIPVGQVVTALLGHHRSPKLVHTLQLGPGFGLTSRT